MEPNSTRDHSSPARNNEVDLGYILLKSGRIFKRFLLSLRDFFYSLGSAILLCLFFLRRNLLWLIIGTALGVGVGIYRESKEGVQYQSQMTLLTNFNSSNALYNTADYINALTSSGRTAELASLFNISPAEAATVLSVSVQPVESELIVADLYRQKFLKYSRNDRVRLDTFWTRVIKYEEFKNRLSDLDYPLHEVLVVSTSPNVFARLQSGLVGYVSQTEILQKSKEVNEVITSESERVLKSSIASLDTLRRVYNQRLLQSSAVPGGTANSLNVFENSRDVKVPELELYDKVMQLNDELTEARRETLMKGEVVQVYSPFNPVGQKVSIFKQSLFRYALMGFLLALAITAFISFYIFLTALEKRQSNRIEKKNVTGGSSAV